MPLDTLYIAETPEGIALSLRPAGVVSRMAAYLVDLAVRLAILFVVALVGNLLGGLGSALVLVTWFFLEWFYPVVFELGRSGATPGKRMMGLQVVMDSGLPVTPAASIVRNLLRAADFLPFLYAGAAVTMLVRADFKRLGDLAAGTLVVYSETVRLHGEIPPAEPSAPSRPLARHEQVAVVAWAARASRLTPERLDELARLAQPVTVQGSGSATARLLGAAQWVLGRRPGTPR